MTYEGVVSLPPATARAIVLAADPVRLSTAPPPVSGAPCVLGLASATALVWRGCADAALARRVMANVPPLTPAALGSPCSRPVCDVRLVRSAPARRHERYGQIAQDIVINASGAFSCATASPDRRETPNVLRVVSGRVRAADAGALFDWLAAGLHRPAGPRAARRWPRGERRGRPRPWRRVDQSRDAAGRRDLDAMGTHRHTTAARVSSAGGRAQVVGGRGALVNARTCCSTAGDQSVCVSFVWKDHGNASG